MLFPVLLFNFMTALAWAIRYDNSTKLLGPFTLINLSCITPISAFILGLSNTLSPAAISGFSFSLCLISIYSNRKILHQFFRDISIPKLDAGLFPLIVVAPLLSLVAMITYFWPIYTWDVLEYHLHPVLLWREQQSIFFRI